MATTETKKKVTAKKTTKKAAAKKAPVKSVKKTMAKPKTTKSKAPSKTQAPAEGEVAQTAQAQKHVEGNPYRAGSFYATCFDCLAKMGTKDTVSRKDLLDAYCKSSGKDEKRAKYDLAVILSPTKEGDGHRSSRKLAYWVERLNGSVRLHMVS